MAQYVVQSDGTITVRYQINEDVLSFRINADAGVPFTPGSIVSISEERLDSVAAQLAQSFGASTIVRLSDDHKNTN